MTELDSRARALLDQYNAAQAPGPEVSERVLAAVQARAVAGDLGPEIPTETAASTTPAPTPTSAWPLGAKLGALCDAIAKASPHHDRAAARGMARPRRGEWPGSPRGAGSRARSGSA